jgi:hypothetical protein
LLDPTILDGGEAIGEEEMSRISLNMEAAEGRRCIP